MRHRYGFIILPLLAAAFSAAPVTGTLADPVAPPNQARAAPTTKPAPTARPAPTTGANEVLFLRNSVLTAHGVASGVERTIADDVHDFAATPDGALIALVRGTGRKAEIWTVQRDGTKLTRRTKDSRTDATPALTADASALVFASANTAAPYTREWLDWGQWCAASEVRLIELATSKTRTLGAGCDPAFAPDNKRIAFATPPTSDDPGFPHSAGNTIRLINRQGKNGWSFSSADGTPERGMVVHAPSWSPDGAQVSFQRFLGYQALVDLAVSEIAPAFKGGGTPFNSGAGWQLPPHFAPNGNSVAVVENNYSDARGFGGYDNWQVTVVTLGGSRVLDMPQGKMTFAGARAAGLARAQGGAWSPAGGTLAVILPPGWSPDLPGDQPVNDGAETPGELWLWQPGQQPHQQLAKGVDFASPLVWLP